jgi:hypothetical protein
MLKPVLLTSALLMLAMPAGRPLAVQPAELSYTRQAFELGRTRDAALFQAFTRSYELPANDAIAHAEVITEFRRAADIVRAEAARANLALTAHDLAVAMQPFIGQVTFIVDARLHPLHAYPMAPPYELYIETGPSTPPLVATPLAREPVFPLGSGPGSAMTAVRLEGTFDRAAIEGAPSPSLVVVDDQADVIWKARIDLSRYR